LVARLKVEFQHAMIYQIVVVTYLNDFHFSLGNKFCLEGKEELIKVDKPWECKTHLKIQVLHTFAFYNSYKAFF
jgi:hypothetical protein